MSSEMSMVRLKAENIDLQQRLDEALAKIDELKQAVTSNTVHVHHPAAKQPHSLGDLKANEGPRDVVSCEEYDKLEQDLEEAFEREEHLKKTISDMRKEIAQLCDANEKLEKNSKGADSSKEGNGDGSGRTNAAAAADFRKISQLEKKEKEQAFRIAELNDMLEALQKELDAAKDAAADKNEAALLAGFADDAVDSAPAPPAKGDGELVATESFIEEEIETRLEDRIAELKAKHEEELFAAGVELQDTIDAQKETISVQQIELEKLKSTMAETLKLESERNTAVRSLEQSVAERNIANKSKEIALQETAHVKAELTKRDAEVRELKRKLENAELDDAWKAGAEGGHAGGPPAWVDTILKEKDAMIAKLQDRVSDLQVKTEFNDTEALKDKSQAIAKMKDAWEKERADLEGNLEREKLEHALCRAERDKALAAGRKAFLERNSAIDETKKLEALQKLQIKKKETDTTMLKDVFAKVMTNYDAVVSKLEEAHTPEQVQETFYEVLFDYERKIWHLNNDCLSLRAIVDIKEEDAKVSYQETSKFQLEEIELLRTALQEAREALQKQQGGGGQTPQQQQHTPNQHADPTTPTPVRHTVTATPVPTGTPRERLLRFYEIYAPQKKTEVDSILQSFAGREDEMFSLLHSKYGPEPTYTDDVAVSPS